MAEHVDLNGLELVLRSYERRFDRERCGHLRVVLARALVGERDRRRRDRVAAMLLRVEALLTGGAEQIAADAGRREGG